MIDQELLHWLIFGAVLIGLVFNFMNWLRS